MLTFIYHKVKAQDPVLPNIFWFLKLNPAFAGTLITEYTGLIHRLNGQMRTDE
jgi:hypothetical protein